MFYIIPGIRKLTESIHSKNNNYLLMDKAYDEDYKTLALAKNYWFDAVIPLKKKS